MAERRKPLDSILQVVLDRRRFIQLPGMISLSATLAGLVQISEPKTALAIAQHTLEHDQSNESETEFDDVHAEPSKRALTQFITDIRARSEATAASTNAQVEAAHRLEGPFIPSWQIVSFQAIDALGQPMAALTPTSSPAEHAQAAHLTAQYRMLETLHVHELDSQPLQVEIDHMSIQDEQLPADKVVQNLSLTLQQLQEHLESGAQTFSSEIMAMMGDWDNPEWARLLSELNAHSRVTRIRLRHPSLVHGVNDNKAVEMYFLSQIDGRLSSSLMPNWGNVIRQAINGQEVLQLETDVIQVVAAMIESYLPVLSNPDVVHRLGVNNNQVGQMFDYDPDFISVMSHHLRGTALANPLSPSLENGIFDVFSYIREMFLYLQDHDLPINMELLEQVINRYQGKLEGKHPNHAVEDTDLLVDIVWNMVNQKDAQNQDILAASFHNDVTSVYTTDEEKLFVPGGGVGERYNTRQSMRLGSFVEWVLHLDCFLHESSHQVGNGFNMAWETIEAMAEHHKRRIWLDYLNSRVPQVVKLLEKHGVLTVTISAINQELLSWNRNELLATVDTINDAAIDPVVRQELRKVYLIKTSMFNELYVYALDITAGSRTSGSGTYQMSLFLDYLGAHLAALNTGASTTFHSSHDFAAEWFKADSLFRAKLDSRYVRRGDAYQTTMALQDLYKQLGVESDKEWNDWVKQYLLTVFSGKNDPVLASDAQAEFVQYTMRVAQLQSSRVVMTSGSSSSIPRLRENKEFYRPDFNQDLSWSGVTCLFKALDPDHFAHLTLNTDWRRLEVHVVHPDTNETINLRDYEDEIYQQLFSADGRVLNVRKVMDLLGVVVDKPENKIGFVVFNDFRNPNAVFKDTQLDTENQSLTVEFVTSDFYDHKQHFPLIFNK